MVYILDNLKNNFDFFLRNYITFSRRNYKEHTDNIDDILSNNNIVEKFNKYNINFLKNTSKRIFLENLYFLNVFDITFSKNKNKNISILDIGSKNWSYVKSEYLFFSSFNKDFILNGIELDPYRLLTNLYSRYEIAKYYTKNLIGTNYIVGDFLKHYEKYDYIIWILPFVCMYPHVKWGLPLKYFKPEEMLSHAYNSLNYGGEMLIINQGEDEYVIQQKLNKNLNLPVKYYGEIKDDFNLFKNKRYCSKIFKNN